MLVYIFNHHINSFLMLYIQLNEIENDLNELKQDTQMNWCTYINALKSDIIFVQCTNEPVYMYFFVKPLYTWTTKYMCTC